MIKDVGPASLGKPQETQGNPSRPYFMSFFKTTLSHTVVSETAVWRFEWSITNIISTIKLQTQIIEKFYGVHINVICLRTLTKKSNDATSQQLLQPLLLAGRAWRRPLSSETLWPYARPERIYSHLLHVYPHEFRCCWLRQLGCVNGLPRHSATRCCSSHIVTFQVLVLVFVLVLVLVLVLAPLRHL